MSQTNSNKYYHNDFKKQMGIDDSRSASEKLLDKVVLSNKVERKDRLQLQVQEDLQATTKRVKQASNQPVTNKAVLQKLSKGIRQQTSLQKLMKSLQILYKCLNDFNFVNDPEINHVQNWLNMWQTLRSCINKRNFYSSQSQTIMQNTADCLSIIQKNLRKYLEIEDQSSQTFQQHKQRIEECLQKLSIERQFCRLFTDDSFVFNKSLKSIKNYIFDVFQQSETVQNKQRQTYAYELLMNLLQLPLKHEWIKTSISMSLKQFNVNHKQKLQQQKKNTYLKLYNTFLQKKCSTSTHSSSSKNQKSFNMMQKPSGGVVRSVQISQQGTGAQKWISKQ